MPSSASVLFTPTPSGNSNPFNFEGHEFKKYLTLKDKQIIATQYYDKDTLTSLVLLDDVYGLFRVIWLIKFLDLDAPFIPI